MCDVIRAWRHKGLQAIYFIKEGQSDYVINTPNCHTLKEKYTLTILT